MQFTYDAYRSLINQLKRNNYQFASYGDWNEYESCVILRHDIDNDIEKALRLAEIEHECGISSTYFVLLTSDFYNVFSARNKKMLSQILELGHEIGLHFDEVRYPSLKMIEMPDVILNEADILSKALCYDIKSVSMHRPSQEVLDADIRIPGIVNSYSQTFFREFKYLSDSRRRWREPVEEIISANNYKRLHILTHAFWYSENELDIHQTVKSFVNSACIERYDSMSDNITNMELIMKRSEVDTNE